jgi:hypothetical protein
MFNGHVILLLPCALCLSQLQLKNLKLLLAAEWYCQSYAHAVLKCHQY